MSKFSRFNGFTLVALSLLATTGCEQFAEMMFGQYTPGATWTPPDYGFTTASGSSSSSSSGSSSGSTSSSSGGTVEPCHPTLDNDHCAGAADCECVVSEDTQEWCDGMKQAGYDLCKNMGSCTPGKNMCGIDLPIGTVYVEPDESCVKYALTTVWNDEDAQYFEKSWGDLNDNYQTVFYNGIISDAYPEAPAFTFSDRSFYQNRGVNKNKLPSAEGKLEGDCTNPNSLTITICYYSAEQPDTVADPANDCVTLYWYGL